MLIHSLSLLCPFALLMRFLSFLNADDVDWVLSHEHRPSISITSCMDMRIVGERERAEEEGGGRWKVDGDGAPHANTPYVFTRHVLPGLTRVHSLRLSEGGGGGGGGHRGHTACGNLLCNFMCLTWPWFSFSPLFLFQWEGKHERGRRSDEHRLRASVSCAFHLMVFTVRWGGQRVSRGFSVQISVIIHNLPSWDYYNYRKWHKRKQPVHEHVIISFEGDHLTLTC